MRTDLYEILNNGLLESEREWLRRIIGFADDRGQLFAEPLSRQQAIELMEALGFAEDDQPIKDLR